MLELIVIITNHKVYICNDIQIKWASLLIHAFWLSSDKKVLKEENLELKTSLALESRPGIMVPSIFSISPLMICFLSSLFSSFATISYIILRALGISAITMLEWRLF